MTKQRRKPLTLGERSRMIKARKDCIMKKIEELQNLTELGACLIIPMPDGKFETWPKDGDKLQRVYKLYEESLLKSQNNINNTNINNVQAQRSCCCVCATGRQSCRDDESNVIICGGAAAGLQPKEVLFPDPQKELEKPYLPCEFDNQLELLPSHETDSLPYSSGMADTTLYDDDDDNTLFQYSSVLQYCYPETNFGSSSLSSTSSVSAVPSYSPAPAAVTLPAASFGLTDQGNNRLFHPYFQDEGKILRSKDLDTSALFSSWDALPQVFTQYHADYNYNMGGWMNNGKRGYDM